jgi:hypothetical protein
LKQHIYKFHVKHRVLPKQFLDNELFLYFMIDNHFIMFILREVFLDKFKCMSLDNLDFLVMFYLEHKDTILVHYVNDTFEEILH